MRGPTTWETLECRTLLSSNPVDVLTYHNDNGRTGQQLHETVLTTKNVNSKTFGKRYSLPVDGKVDAQPLYVAGVVITGFGTHNVLIVATEHDSLYAFDVDTRQQLWKTRLLKPGETPSDSRGSDQVTPEIGITATPVIDINHATVCAVAMSKDAAGNYHQRLHAINLFTGQEKYNGPTEIAASYPGTGDNSKNGRVIFDPKQYKERAALLLVNGVVYTSWASHSDHRPYTSWVIAYDELSLRQVSVLDLTPNGNAGAFWAAGGGPAADASGNVFLMTGNGTFDTSLTLAGFPSSGDYGNTFLKLSGNLHVLDYFAPYNTVALSSADLDLGSSSNLLIPDQLDAQGHVHHLEVGAGKSGVLYVVDRDKFGKYNKGGSSNSNVYQDLGQVFSGGIYSTPAYFNGNIYYGAVSDHLKDFRFSNARLGATPASSTSMTFGYPGTSPAVSANGSSNGIVWATSNGTVAGLYAFDANNLGNKLYDSNQAGTRDHFGVGNKFITPMIANGKVFVGTTNSVAVFGLLYALPTVNDAPADNIYPRGRKAPGTPVARSHKVDFINAVHLVGRAYTPTVFARTPAPA